MKLNELMKGVTPDPAYEGWVTNDDFVFAIDLTPGAEQATEVHPCRKVDTADRNAANL